VKNLSPSASRSGQVYRRLTVFFLALFCLAALILGATAFAQSRKNRSRQVLSAKEKKDKKPKAVADKKLHNNEPVQEDIEGRDNWFLAQRMYPFNELPENARRNAWNSRPIVKGISVETLTWQPIGPVSTSSAFAAQWGSTSGRISAIAVSPTNANLLLVGSPTGGLWRSTDGGTNFSPVTDTLTDVSIGSIAFAPSNTQIVYAGAGDASNRAYFGSGVLKSTDGGVTWTKVSDATLPGFGVIRHVAVDPTDPNIVYAIQYNRVDTATNQRFAGGFYRSTNGGVTWTRPIRGLFRNMALRPGTPQTIYLGAQRVDPADPGTPPGVYRSTNGGTNWTLVHTAPFTTTSDVRVAVTAADNQRVYVYEGGTNGGNTELRVEMSSTAGDTWTNRGVRTDIDAGQFDYNTYIFASPTNASTVFVGSRDIFKSTDNGLNFNNIVGNFAAPTFNDYTPEQATTHSDQQTLTFSPTDSNTIYFGNDGGLFRSTNGGTTLQSLNNTLSLTQFIGYAIDPNDTARSYGGTQDNGSQRRQNGTSQWAEVDGGDGGNFVVDQVTPSIVFSTYINGSITRFINFGATQQKAVGTNAIFGEPADNPRIDFYPPFVGNGVNSKLYFGTWKLFISNDRGDTWNAPAGGTDLTAGDPDVLSAIAVARSNTNTIYIGSNQGRVRVSTNEGVAWTDITAGLPNRTITSINVNSITPATAFLTVSGFGSGHVFKTVNCGGTWTDISGNLPNIPTNCLLIDPQNANTLYVGTDIGVFISTTGGNTWTTFNNGLPPVVVTKLVASGNIIQAGTYGRGAYQLNDVGGGSTVQFNAANFPAGEGAGFLNVTVTRGGDTSGAASVSYASSNGTGKEGKDYVAASGVVSFAAGENSKTFPVLIIDNAFVDGSRTVNLTLSNPTGSTLAAQNTATLTVSDNDAIVGANPLDTPRSFVQLDYYDFLGRYPDTAGWDFWTNQITNCGGNAQCIEVARINVSASFFLSIEFQQTGYLVERFYKIGYGNATGNSTLNGNHQLSVPIVRFNEFIQDTQRIGRGVIVLQPGWEALLEANKVAYSNEFVQTTRFTTAFPTSLTPAQFVNQLNTNAGNVLTAGEITTAVNLFGGAGNTTNTSARAQAVRQVAENAALNTAEFNRAFVLAEYFGYLRRNPNDAPEATLDYTGYEFWLNKLNEANGNYINAEMVKAFLSSIEYRQRFAP
jgi:Calx-beta domain